MSARLLARLVTLLALGCAAPMPALAFDFGNLLDKVKQADVNKIIETSKQVIAATQQMSESEEIQLGHDLAGRLLGAMPPIPDVDVQHFVNRLGRWLSLQTTRPDLPWHFAVVANDSLGAFATPGGYVFVTSALVGLMRDENELAGVLAHEIAHVVEYHHVLAVMKKARAEITRDVVADLAADYSKGNPMVTQVLLDSGMDVYASGLDQEDEFAADLAGVQIAASAGYDPYGLLMLLATLDALDPSEPRAAFLFATHPDTRTRIDRLAAAATAFGDAYPAALTDTARFETLRAQLAAP